MKCQYILQLTVNNKHKFITTIISFHDRLFQPTYGNVPKPDGPALEEYRLRSFSITASGVCNLGDFVRYASPPPSTRHRRPIDKRDSCPASVSGTPQRHQPYANAPAPTATTTTTATTAAASSHTVCTEFSRFRKPRYLLIHTFNIPVTCIPNWKKKIIIVMGRKFRFLSGSTVTILLFENSVENHNIAVG